MDSAGERDRERERGWAGGGRRGAMRHNTEAKQVMPHTLDIIEIEHHQARLTLWGWRTAREGMRQRGIGGCTSE